LTKLIASNPNVSKWMFKIDNESSSRGTALLDTNLIPVLTKMRKQYEFNDESIEKLYNILRKNVGKKAIMCCPQLYDNFNEYISEFTKHGGVIEGMPDSIVGYPCFCFDLQPDGSVADINSYEKIHLYNQTTGAYSTPQTSLAEIDVEILVNTVATSLFSKDIFGFVSIEFVAFNDPNAKDQVLFWAVDLNIGMNNVQSISIFLN